MLRAVKALLVEAEVFHDQQVRFGMASRRGCDHQGVRRRSQHRIHDIQLGAGCATNDNNDIAELFVVSYTLEGP